MAQLELGAESAADHWQATENRSGDPSVQLGNAHVAADSDHYGCGAQLTAARGRWPCCKTAALARREEGEAAPHPRLPKRQVRICRQHAAPRTHVLRLDPHRSDTTRSSHAMRKPPPGSPVPTWGREHRAVAERCCVAVADASRRRSHWSHKPPQDRDYAGGSCYG